MKIRIVMLVVISLFLMGCSSISGEEAESIALGLIKDNVFFFAQDEGRNIGFDEYEVSPLTSYQENDEWVVVAHITADLDGEEKKKDLIIKIDLKGTVVEFDGQRVS